MHGPMWLRNPSNAFTDFLPWTGLSRGSFRGFYSGQLFIDKYHIGGTDHVGEVYQCVWPVVVDTRLGQSSWATIGWYVDYFFVCISYELDSLTMNIYR